ncbi:RagB/SusD family nutrient uptake outer membrane protein [Sunxiuqinia sp. A32]|uniref:RagB/SusD family nutrient uptake outer membrane protein n=1 Tax=Sunxiuqinia sp. A32 TaxID=3461496 RepID=UPI00404568AE
MKLKYLKYFIFILVFNACDVLDKEPIDIISDAAVWTDEDLADANLTNLYRLTNKNTVFNDQSSLNVITDEARTCFGWSALLNVFTLGVINPNNVSNDAYIGFWDYHIIRQYNEFLLNMETSDFDEGYKQRRMAECRFLRALHYFNLAMRLGGVPIITTPQQFGDEDLYPSRNTEKEVYEFVRTELDEIIEILPPSYNTANKGRVNRFAALALKSRAMLYAGSIAKYSSVDLDGILGVPTSDANFYFEESYNASNRILTESNFSLFRKYGDKSKNYQYLFLEKDNVEVIWAEKYTQKDLGHGYDYNNQPISYKPFIASVTNPTLEMVDSYEFNDGSPGSSINYDQEIDTKELYKNKDPRFHATILYNQAFWIDTPVETHYFTIESDIATDNRVRNLSGRGKDVNNVAAGATQTGFCIKKYLKEEREIRWGLSDTDFIIFRLGEIYLNLAEAAFELGKPNEAKDAVNEIRNRAGMPEYELIDMDKIRHERKIELAFEGIRFWDLRRWRTAHTELTGVFHKLTSYYIKERNTFGYLIQNCQGNVARSFEEKHYYLPLQLNHVTENPNLKQNPEYN